MNKQIEQHYAENFDKLVKRFSHRAGGVADAEDVVQEAFALALKYKDSFNPDNVYGEKGHKTEFGGWFNGILNNSLKLYKKKERLLGMSVEYSEDMDELVPLMEWEDNLIEAVKKDIARKPEQVRQALWLYIFKQYKPREIAQVVEMSNAYIRTSVKEFKQEMRAKYGEVV